LYRKRSQCSVDSLDIVLNQWFAKTPLKMVNAHLHAADKLIQALRKGKGAMVPA
jgi:hypothetical protein